MTLDTIRAAIDDIDTGILLLIRRRMQCSENIAAIKRRAPIKDPARERALTEAWEKRAATLNLSPALARSVLSLLLTESKKIQRKKRRT